MSAEPSTLAQRQAQDRFRLKRLGLFLLTGTALNLGLVLSGAAAGLRDLTGDDTLAQRALFVAAYGAVTSAAQLPLEYLLGYRQERRAGLLRLGTAAWLRQWGAASAVSTVVQGSLYLAVSGVFRAAPDAWLPGAAAAITVFLGALVALQPWLTRRAVRLRPLTDERVSALAQTLFAQAGVRLTGLQVAEVSRNARVANAFVQPSLRGAQLIVSDTLLAQASDEELRFVIAHELGHHARRDLWRLLAWQWLSLLGMVGAAAILLGTLGTQGGLQGAGDIGAVPVLALAFTLAQRGLDLVGHALKRQMEYRADTYALRLTGDLDGMARVLERLSDQNLQDPNPPRAAEVLFHDHPAHARRLAAARRVLAQPLNGVRHV
ncbi:M48 family metalloprotease [Deinococcus aquaedulcis]|uniref:M48 family metalloprotease n=1 Tax=Deinococcus aquaedulcis TaxID=2840455 RepID=UPI001C83E194|nr:M48 family metalloprotease [Deinococcus aquaedulcis]